VRQFLADLRSGWDQQTPELQNEFLRLVLDRVLVRATPEQADVVITWRSGAQQRLWVERPRLARGRKTAWTPAEDECLRSYYPAATSAQISARLPNRAYSAIQARASTMGIRREPHAIHYRRGAAWTEGENAAVRAYAAGEIGHAELGARLPRRTPEAIQTQQRVLGLRRRGARLHYRVTDEALEMLPTGSHSRTASQAIVAPDSRT
jgi:hypothetical protein